MACNIEREKNYKKKNCTFQSIRILHSSVIYSREIKQAEEHRTKL